MVSVVEVEYWPLLAVTRYARVELFDEGVPDRTPVSLNVKPFGRSGDMDQLVTFPPVTVGDMVIIA